jgi:hypothetical protein
MVDLMLVERRTVPLWRRKSARRLALERALAPARAEDRMRPAERAAIGERAKYRMALEVKLKFFFGR